MPRLTMTALFVLLLLSARSTHAEKLDNDKEPCTGSSIGRFESRFPAGVRRLEIYKSMLGPFVELWRTGSRPELPRRPERVIIYAVPQLPLVIAYQERHCIIAYLTVDSAVLWQWLRPRLGWKV